MAQVIEMPIENIERDSEQPRKNFEDIGLLCSSILKEGLLEPLKVEYDEKKGKYMLIDGERRHRALEILSKQDKLYKNVSVIIIKSKNRFITQLSTDIHKRKLSVFEEAEAFDKIINSGKYELEDLPAILGIRLSYITKRLKLLALSNKTQRLIKEKKIPASVIMDVDFKRFKGAEQEIIREIDSIKIFKNKNSTKIKIKRIIEEKLNSKKAIIEQFNKDLNSFTDILKQFEYKIEEYKIEEYIGESLEDAIKSLNKTIEYIDKLEISNNTIKSLYSRLKELKKVYGGNAEISNKMIKENSQTND